MTSTVWYNERGRVFRNCLELNLKCVIDKKKMFQVFVPASVQCCWELDCVGMQRAVSLF